MIGAMPIGVIEPTAHRLTAPGAGPIKGRFLKMLGLLVLTAVLLNGCGKPDSGAASTPPRDSGPALVSGDIEQAIQISGEALAEGDEVTMLVDITLIGPTAHFSIGPEKPTGMRMQAVADGKGQPLGEVPDVAGVLDEYGYLAGNYYAQIVVADLDSDGTYEVLASIGNGEDTLRTMVYRYQSGQEEPFLPVGVIDGAASITIENGIIHAPGSSLDDNLRLRLEGDALVVQ